jgi:hypothetical protein
MSQAPGHALIGTLFFHGASDLLYRRIAYAIIAVAALVSLPLFDHWLRKSMIPKMPVPGLDPGMETGFRIRSCSNKKSRS